MRLGRPYLGHIGQNYLHSPENGHCGGGYEQQGPGHAVVT